MLHERKPFLSCPGDLALHQLDSGAREDIFPTGHYHGITIQIDLDNSLECMACFLDDVDVEPTAIANKFKLEENFFFAWRQLPSIEHIFSELYAVPRSIKKGYFKMKILELLLFNDLEGQWCLGSDEMGRFCQEADYFTLISTPFNSKLQRAAHLPFMGEKGMDYLVELKEEFFDQFDY